jgi:hypothetical protein
MFMDGLIAVKEARYQGDGRMGFTSIGIEQRLKILRRTKGGSGCSYLDTYRMLFPEMSSR